MRAEAAAAALLAARRDGRPAGPLPADIAPRTNDEGAIVQVALAGLLGALPPGGFKIGAIARRMQENLGISEPIAGFMQTRDIHDSGVALPYASFRGVGVECELAVRLARDLPALPTDAATAALAVGELFAAIEIVPEKNAAAYRDVIARHGLVKEQTWMVGNSPLSDINPALAAGLNAVFIPYNLTWVLENCELATAPHPAARLVLERFTDLEAHF